MSVAVRYFAGAKAAAGTGEEILVGSTLGDVVRAASAAHPGDLERALGLSSFLIDGVSVTDLATAVRAGQRVDVLPPFAGG